MTTNGSSKPLPRLMIGTADMIKPGDTILTRGPALVLDVIPTSDDMLDFVTLNRSTMTFHPAANVSWFRSPLS